MKIFIQIKNILIFVLWLITLNHNAQAAYLASIPPLHSLLSGILKDVDGATVDGLLDGQISPHTFALKPSHIKKIRQAQVIFWIGPSYETFLVKPLETFAPINIKIIDVPDLVMLPLRRDGDWQHGCCHHDHGATDKTSSQKLIDMHVWLNINNAVTIAQYFYHYFVNIYPNQQLLLKRNLDRIIYSLKNLDHQLATALDSYKHSAFLVHHDGYQYFEKAYSLNGIGVIISNPERAPSVNYVKNLINDARSKQVRCIFSESQFNSRFVDELVRTLNARTATLELFGLNYYHDERDYTAMMQNITDNFIKCFKD